jgi:hypothetical protein
VDDNVWTCLCSSGWSGTDCGIPDDPLTSAKWCPTKT